MQIASLMGDAAFSYCDKILHYCESFENSSHQEISKN
jgi:hypothetical protein